MVTNGQLIALMSHTIGSIGQIVKGKKYDDKSDIGKIVRIYKSYIQQITREWHDS